MYRNIFKRTILGVTIAAALGNTAIASDHAIAQGFTFSLGGGYHWLDSDRKVDDSWTPDIGIGYRFNDRWSTEAAFSRFTTDQSNNDNDATIKSYRIDGFYDLIPWQGDWTPYVLASIDHQYLDRDEGSSDRDNRLGMGGGIRKALTPNLSVKTDIRALQGMDTGNTDTAFNVALTWTFGSAPAAMNQTTSALPPADSDMDGVPDDRDQCSNTPAGAVVDQYGCTPAFDAMEMDMLVEFDFNSADIRSIDKGKLKEAADFVKEHRNVQVSVEGHSDSRGAAAYNQKLSLNRAEAVKTVLVDQYDISAYTIKTMGLGETQPVASNETPEGRQQNRRVIIEAMEVEVDME
ncbi:Outer membrane porin F [invertebrate metagenome]|uniref:Outer membrane porin F n=1 Tax=invertebrate metagenome TaxID=1711999 RepID=A0A2H9T2M2_9ZZZZ